MLPIDDQVSRGVLLQGAAGALIDTIPNNPSRRRNAGTRRRGCRAEQAAWERCPHIVAPLEKAVFSVEDGKESAMPCNALRRAEEHISARPQRIMECPDQAVLQWGVEVDQ